MVGKLVCSAGLHGWNYPLHNHMHNVNHCCKHDVVQFTEYQNCNDSSYVATLLPKIVNYKFVFLPLPAQSDSQTCHDNRETSPITLIYNSALFLPPTDSPYGISHAVFVLLIADTLWKWDKTKCFFFRLVKIQIAVLKTVSSLGRDGTKYGQFSNFKRAHQRIRNASVMKAAGLFIQMMNVDYIGLLCSSRHENG